MGPRPMSQECSRVATFRTTSTVKQSRPRVLDAWPRLTPSGIWHRLPRADPRRIAMNDVITISDDTFDEAVGLSDIPVVVDFWAEWCGPCKVVAPILDEIASANSGKLKVAKLNVDDNPRTAQRFKVMSIPTLLLFKNGETQARIVGARSKSQILSEFEPLL